MSNPAPSERPWYRQFWPWFIMTPPIATVIGSIVTVIIAGGPPALVVDDYGEVAMAVEQDQRRDRRAAELGVVARLQLLPGANAAAGRQDLRVALGGASPPGIRLEFIHPTRGDLDRRYDIASEGSSFTGQIDRPQTRVYVQITDAAATWRVTGELQPGQQELELRAMAPD
jgi:hypothetical protein